MTIAKFIRRSILFFLVAFALLSVESLVSYFTKTYQKEVNGNEVYLSLKKAKAKKKVKLLIIGDSVGKQLYDNETYNGAIYSLACNQAISLAGQYILLEKFIENNKTSLPDEVIMIITAETFTNNLNQVFTFHYFLKPFYNQEFKPLLTATALTQIRKVPLYYLSQLPLILNTNWSPSYTAVSDTSYHFISPVSNNYLLKIKALCTANHLPLKLICPPIKTSRKQLNLDYAKNIREIAKTGLQNEFKDYFQNIRFLPDSLYIDKIHFKKQFIPVDLYHFSR
jgi:hypothetical protein